jgi:hypothetical protein
MKTTIRAARAAALCAALALALSSCFDLSAYVSKDGSGNVVGEFRFSVSASAIELSEQMGDQYSDSMDEFKKSVDELEESFSSNSELPSFVKAEAIRIDDGADYGFALRFTYPLSKAQSIPLDAPLVPRVSGDTVTIKLPASDMGEDLGSDSDPQSLSMAFSGVRMRFYVGASLAPRVVQATISPADPFGAKPVIRQYKEFAIVEVPFSSWMLAEGGLTVTITTGK